LITNLPASLNAYLISPWSTWFIVVSISSRLLKKFVTPVLANCGVTFLYVKAAGFKSFSSNFSLKIKMFLFRSSNGSFISSPKIGKDNNKIK
jgi:hypothetical protein